MQFDLRIVDPPAGWGETLLTLFVVLGAVAGAMSVVGRLIGRHLRGWDAAVWLAGATGGALFGRTEDYNTTFFALLIIGACMAAGMWLASTRPGELKIHGLRLLEAAAFTAITGVALSWARHSW